MSNDREAVLSALGEAAQEIIHKLKILREALREDALVCLSNTHQQLDEALETLNLDSFASFYPGEFEEPDEYELIGTIDGTYAGRWMIAAFAENASAVWPDNTAVYVRRIKR
jgi:hypothetical protein